MKNARVTTTLNNLDKSPLDSDVNLRHTPSLEEAKKYIYSIDFSMIINKLTGQYKWLKVEAEKTCKQYKNYLWLLKLHGLDKSLPPSKDIDEFFHHHILSTKQFTQDSKAIFGQYLHHNPYFGIDGKTNINDLNRSFKETQKLYLQEFGEYIQPTRYRFRWLAKLFLKIGLLSC